jgi:uncharacterized protein YbjT (DUF2867 family)
MVLVVGATSRVGVRVIPMLLSKGINVRAMTRTRSKAEGLRKQGAEIVVGDVRDAASLERACMGVDMVLAAAHGFPGEANNNPHTVDDIGNRNLIDAAKVAGVKQFVFISILGCAPTSPLEFFRLKYATEKYLEKSGLIYTILRCGPFMEFWGTMVGGPILAKRQAIIFGRGNNPIGFVSAEDVAKFSSIALEDPKARNQAIDVAGPENLTFNQVVEIFERASGRIAKKKHIPLPMMHIMRLVTRPFNPVLSLQITGGILLDTIPHTCDMGSTLMQYPVELTRLEEVARRMVAAHPL